MLIGVTLVLWVPLAAIILYLALQSHAAQQNEAEAQLRNAARSAAVAIDARLDAYLAGLSALAHSELLRAPLDVPAFEAQARAVGTALGGIVLLYGPSPATTPILTTSPETEALRQRIGAGWLREATRALVERIDSSGRPGVSDLFIAPVRPRPLVTLGIPVPQDPRPGRRLHLTIEPAMLAALLDRVGIPAGTTATVRDGRGTVVASSDPALRAGSAAPIPWVAESLGASRQAVLAGEDEHGEPVRVAAERLATDPRWLVTVVAPQDSKGPSLLRLGWHIAGLNLGMLGIGGVIWAVRRDRVLGALAETAVLRDAQMQADRLLAGLPAVLAVRGISAEGEPGPLLYRAGDVEGVTGWPAGELRDALRGDLAEFPEQLRSFRLRLVREGAASLEWRMLQPNGSWRWLRWTARRLETLQDGSIIAVGYVVDASAERAAQAQAQAAGRLASMAEMAHGLAHELKQPLQAITLQAEVAQVHLARIAAGATLSQALRLHADNAETALAGIVDQAVRTARLVEHLRRFARGSGEDAPPGPVSLAEALEDALLLVGSGLENAGITLERDLGDPPPRVLGHAIAIEQILINLLNNARDAFAGLPPEVPRRIRIAARRTEAPRGVLLTVSDTAGGIPEHILTRIFEPFVTTKGIDEGTGLGLAICHGLARSMGATIEAVNTAEGAVFSVRLLAAEEGEAPRAAA